MENKNLNKLLFKAVRESSLVLVKSLIKKGADVKI